MPPVAGVLYLDLCWTPLTALEDLMYTTDPLTIDTELAARYAARADLQTQAGRAIARLRAAAGERKVQQGAGRTVRWVWPTTFLQVLARARENTSRYGIAEALADWDATMTEMAGLDARINTLDAIYQASPWQRFFPCLNTDGHIHATLAGCPSVQWDTAMGWAPEMSGHSIQDAVDALGARLCTKCFPTAPVEQCNGTWRRDDAAKAERAAAKAERAEVKAAKTLTVEQSARAGRTHRGDRVTTVAGCLTAIRDAVEMANYSGIGDAHTNAPEAAECAARCREILLARGAHTPEQLDQVAARKLAALTAEFGRR